MQPATDALKATMVANLETELRAVETAEGLASGALTDPVAYVKARGVNDNRSPLIQIFADGTDPLLAGQRGRRWSAECSLLLWWLGTTDLEANELFAERYSWALIEVLTKNPTLTGLPVTAAIITGVEVAGGGLGSVSGVDDPSATRYVVGIGIEVHTHNPA